MSLSIAARAKLLEATREMATVLLEDIDHLRAIARSQSPSKGDLRRLSNTLRRLLVNGDLKSVAAPRIGKFTFVAPDNSAIYEAEGKEPYRFFCSGGADIYGRHIGPTLICDEPRISGNPPNRSPHQLLRLRVDPFLAQPILCIEGHWANRRQAIQYVAIVASGVHSNAPESTLDQSLYRISKAVRFTYNNGRVGILFDIGNLHGTRPMFRHEPISIDPVLFEILATAHWMIRSPDLSKLESVIRAEMLNFLDV
jgi:hypothetical protein